MTPIEGRSLWKGGIFLVALSLIRMGMDRVGVMDPGGFVDGTDLPHLLEESRDSRDEAQRRSLPLEPGETLDPNRSGEEELDRLPGFGPATAKALLADRLENGGYVRPEDLLRVRGIGPATLAKVLPYLDFTNGVPRDLRGSKTRSVEGGVDPDESGATATLPLTSSRVPHGPPVDLNRAGAEELQSLPGVGPALAQRILDSRWKEGPFRKPADLLRVRGIGPATLARIRDRVIPGG